MKEMPLGQRIQMLMSLLVMPENGCSSSLNRKSRIFFQK